MNKLLERIRWFCVILYIKGCNMTQSIVTYTLFKYNRNTIEVTPFPHQTCYTNLFDCEIRNHFRNRTHHWGPHDIIVTDQSALKHWADRSRRLRSTECFKEDCEINRMSVGPKLCELVLILYLTPYSTQLNVNKTDVVTFCLFTILLSSRLFWQF